ncbi:MAG: hypothetical protein E7159_05950 [Firmicutes bacterium]|nr:hypothetical protein [Bacillota bacterium]
MKKIKEFLNNFNKKTLKRSLLFSLIVMLLIITIAAFDLTQARYETATEVRIEPDLAFFIVDVESQTGQIKLESMLPSTTPYLYTFNVSNFKDTKKANVDLKYSIEIITTTNMPLNYKVYKGTNTNSNKVSNDYFVTDDNGMYYRHLVIDDVSYFNYNQRQTDVYTLWVEYPIEYKAYPKEYAGIIDLVDIKINAEQVV